MRSFCAVRQRAAEPADPCAVPGYLLFGDSQLDRVNAAVEKEKALNIVVLGGASSTLPGPDGANFAYPARLEAALDAPLAGRQGDRHGADQAAPNRRGNGRKH